MYIIESKVIYCILIKLIYEVYPEESTWLALVQVMAWCQKAASYTPST